MSKRICFTTYGDWEELLKKLDAESFRELVLAVFSYGLRKEVPVLSPVTDLLFASIKPVMERDWEKYEKIVDRNKANSKNAGRKPKELNGNSGNPNNPVDFFDSEKNRNNSVDNLGIQTPQIINNEIINKQENNIESNDSLSVVADTEDKVDYKEVVSFYNKSVKGHNITTCIKLTETRKAAIRARIKEYGIEKVYEAITKTVNSSFCNGKNNRNWKADFDFVFNANKMAKILEGKYDDDKCINYGNNGNSNEQSIRKVGESVLGEIFAEIEERRRIEGITG